MLVGYGGNSRSLNDGADVGGGIWALIWPTVKLLARNLVPGKRSTNFFYVDRNQKTFVPDFEALVEMLRKGEIEVRIRKVLRLEEVQDMHREWTKLGGIGSVVVKVDE